jgi:hypothetical protein
MSSSAPMMKATLMDGRVVDVPRRKRNWGPTKRCPQCKATPVFLFRYLKGDIIAHHDARGVKVVCPTIAARKAEVAAKKAEAKRLKQEERAAAKKTREDLRAARKAQRAEERAARRKK